MHEERMIINNWRIFHPGELCKNVRLHNGTEIFNTLHFCNEIWILNLLNSILLIRKGGRVRQLTRLEVSAISIVYFDQL
jgi:hypothetical protein